MSDVELPIFDATRAEIMIDPDAVAREIDEALIRWHLAHQTNDLR